MQKFEGVVSLFYKLIFFTLWGLTELKVWFNILVFWKIVVDEQVVPWLRNVDNILEIVSERLRWLDWADAAEVVKVLLLQKSIQILTVLHYLVAN